MREIEILKPITSDPEGVLPMPEQKPHGKESESDRWYQYTLYPDKLGTPEDRRVVVVMAHDDDVEEFAGGAIGKLVDKGYSVTAVTMTDGRYGGDSRHPMTHQELVHTRLEETIAAAEVLGITRVINLGAIDSELPQDPLTDKPLLDHLIAVMRQEGGGIYITHAAPWNPHTRDYHPDHKNTTPFVVAAVQRARFGNYKVEELGKPLTDIPTLLFADTQGSKSENGHAGNNRVKASNVHFLVDITESADRKSDAFIAYQSQIHNHPDGMPDYVMQRRELDRFRANQSRRRFFLPRPQFAEGYNVHAAHGFNTDLSKIFDRQDVRSPKKIFIRRHVPTF